MPFAGRQLEPVARQRMTNSKSRLVMSSFRSKKMPPRKGLKKRSMIASEKPEFWKQRAIWAESAGSLFKQLRGLHSPQQQITEQAADIEHFAGACHQLIGKPPTLDCNAQAWELLRPERQHQSPTSN